MMFYEDNPDIRRARKIILFNKLDEDVKIKYIVKAHKAYVQATVSFVECNFLLLKNYVIERFYKF